MGARAMIHFRQPVLLLVSTLVCGALVAACGPEARRAPLPSKRTTNPDVEMTTRVNLPWTTLSLPAVVMVEVPESLVVTAGAPWTPIVVNVLDTMGEELAETTLVEVEIELTNGHGELLGTLTKTAEAGVAVFSDLSYERAERIQLEITASGDYVGVMSGIEVDVEPAPAARLALSLPYKSVSAGEGLSATITAYDAFDNVATGFEGPVVVHTNANLATVPAPFALVDGQVELYDAIVLRTAGKTTVSASTAEEDVASASRTVEVVPMAAVAIELSGVPGSAVAGTAIGGDVTVRDEFGNVATGFDGEVAVLTTEAAVWSTATLSKGQGSIEIALQTAGPQAITVAAAVATGQSFDASADVWITAAAPASLAFETSPVVGTVGQWLDPAPTVVVRDPFGNPADGTAPVTLSVMNAAASLSGVPVEKTVGGAAEFDQVAVAGEGMLLRLVAAMEGVEPVYSAPFDVYVSVEQSVDQLSTVAATPGDVVFHGRGTTAQALLTGFSGAIGDPGALCTDWAGNLYIGQEAVGSAPRPVVKVSPQGSVSVSKSTGRPVGMATFKGALHTAGGAEVRGPIASFDGGEDPAWAVIAGADLRDLALDEQTGRAYVVDDSGAGEVIEIDGITLETRVLLKPADEAAIAVHPDTRDLWVVTKNGGEVYAIDTGTGDGETVVMADVWDVTRVEHVEFHAVGPRTMLYATVRTADDAGVYRWSDDAGAGSLQPWVTGLTAAPPVGLACGGVSGNDPLYVSTRQSGIVALQCPTHAAGTSEAILVSEPGRQVSLTASLPAGETGGPTAVAVDPVSGATVAVSKSAGAVYVVSDDIVTAGGLDEPRDVAFDSTGRVYVATRTSILQADSVDALGQEGALTQWAAIGQEVYSIAVDPADSNAVWVVVEGGLVRVTQSGDLSTVALAGEPSIAVGDGVIWALDTAGSLWTIATDTFQVTAVTSFSALIPTFGQARMLAVAPDGHLYATAWFHDPGRDVIARWDPETDTLVELVLTGDEPAMGVAVDPTAPCLVFTAPTSGRVHRICECD